MKLNMHRKIALLLFAFMLIFSANVSAASLNGVSNVNVGDTFTLTFNFGQNVGAYNSINVTFNDNVIEFVSGYSLSEGL